MSETNPLLNKESVQGAAKHIEGLLDSKGVISKPQKEEAPCTDSLFSNGFVSDI